MPVISLKTNKTHSNKCQNPMLNKCFNCLHSVNQSKGYSSNEVFILDPQPGDSMCTLHGTQFSN